MESKLIKEFLNDAGDGGGKRYIESILGNGIPGETKIYLGSGGLPEGLELNSETLGKITDGLVFSSTIDNSKLINGNMISVSVNPSNILPYSNVQNTMNISVDAPKLDSPFSISSKTGISFDELNNVIGSYSSGKNISSLQNYYNTEKGKYTRVVEMSPQDYLDNLTKLTSYKDLEDFYKRSSEETIQKYAEIMRTRNGLTGGGFPMLTLDFDNPGKYTGQEGIHRALAAMQAGLDTVPVAIRFNRVPESETSNIAKIMDSLRYRKDITNAAEQMIGSAWIRSKLSPNAIKVLERAAKGDLRSIAEFSGKPIVMNIVQTDDGPVTQYIYYRGIDPKFDEEIGKKFAAISKTGNKEIDDTSIKNAAESLGAVKVTPDQTPSDIIEAKNKKDISPKNSPDTADDSWEKPYVQRDYTDLNHWLAATPNSGSLEDIKGHLADGLRMFKRSFEEDVAPKFEEVFPTKQEQDMFVRSMDYLFDLQAISRTPVEKAIGKKFTDRDGAVVEITQKGVEFYEDVLNDFMQPYREASAAGLGLSRRDVSNMVKTGYLPHTEQNPLDSTAEEFVARGNLWKAYSGSSTTADDTGSFTTSLLNSDLRTRMNVFASNMLWDSMGNKVATAKYMEELHADGIDASAEDVAEMVQEELQLSREVESAPSANKVFEQLDSDTYTPEEIGEQAILEEELANTKEALKDAQERLTRAREARDAANSELDDITQKFGALDEELNHYKEAHENAMSLLARAREKRDAAEADKDVLTQEIGRLNEEIEKLKKAPKKNESAIEKAEDSKKKVEEKAEKAKTEVKEAKEEVKAAQTEAKSAEAKVKEAEDKVDSAKTKAEGAETKAKKAEESVAKAETKVEKADEKVKKAEAKVEKAKNKPVATVTEELDKEAQTVDPLRKIKTARSKVVGSFKNADGHNDPAAGPQSFMTLSSWLRKVSTPDGSLYDNGGALLVHPDAYAKFLAYEILKDKDSVKDVEIRKRLVKFLMNVCKRSRKGAGFVADKWMNSIYKIIADSDSSLTTADLIAVLQQKIRSEGMKMAKNWVGRAYLDAFNKTTKKYLNSFLYRNHVYSNAINTKSFAAKTNRAIDKIIKARMQSLFWFNFHTAAVQLTELSRVFTEFKLGDAATSVRKLAFDREFANEVSVLLGAIVPEYKQFDTSGLDDASNKILSKIKKTKAGSVMFELGDEIKGVKKTFEELGMAPIELCETIKNRAIMAAILAEAKRLGLSGDTLFAYVNKRFEVVSLAGNKMGRLMGSDNPLFRVATNLQSFAIRELNMNAETLKNKNLPESFVYILKKFGFGFGFWIIASALGINIGLAALLGIDPFGLSSEDGYNGVDEEDYNDLDKILTQGPTGTLTSILTGGGFTSYLWDFYWAGRKAYLESAKRDEVGDVIDDGSIQFANPFQWEDREEAAEDIIPFIGGFVPGGNFATKTLSMIDLISTGWRYSETGNKMYAAPEDASDVISGFVLGPSHTSNAETYFQTPNPVRGAIENGAAGFGREVAREIGFSTDPLNLGEYKQFDPIDREGFTDWFTGGPSDEQQWRTGYFYYQRKMRAILDKYEKALNSAFGAEQKRAILEKQYEEWNEAVDELKRFTDAYVSKNPKGFDRIKMNNVLNILKTYNVPLNARVNITDDEGYSEFEEAESEAWTKALTQYADKGFPQITTTRYNEDDGVTLQFSPQYQAVDKGTYGTPKEAAQQIEAVFGSSTWKQKIRDFNNTVYSDEFKKLKSKEKQAFKDAFINEVRGELDKIVAIYGPQIFNGTGNDPVNDVLEDIVKAALPYGTNPGTYFAKKYKDFSSISNFSYTSNSTETIAEIRKLIDEGKTARAKALARALIMRVQENRISMSRSDLEYLQSLLK